MNNKMSKLLAIVLCVVMMLSSVAAVTADSLSGDADAAPAGTAAPAESTPSAEPAAPAEDPSETDGQDPAAPAEEPSETDGEDPAPAEEPVCTCEATEEEKAAEDFQHQEGCPLYAAPVDPDFDAEAAKEQLLASESLEAVNDFMAGLTEAQANALLEIITEDEIRALADRLGIGLEEEVVTPPADYTAVGPLMPAVTVETVRRMLRSAAAPQAEDEENGLILDKKAVYDPETDTTKITLEAYTTGEVTSSSKSTPVDIVLVLDESGSMADSINQYTKVYQLDKNKSYYVKSGNSYIRVSYCNNSHYAYIGQWYPENVGPGWYSGFHFIGHWGTRYDPMTSEGDNTSGHVQFYEARTGDTSKRAALQSAANAFVDKVNADATANNVDHRVSVIGFSGSSTIKIGLVNDIRNNVNDVHSAINGLNADGGTYIEKGMANAESVFQNAAPAETAQRKRVVVVFTDGIPGTGTWNSDTISNSADPAIKSANTLKNTYGATVYSIGMLDDANPELEISNESNDAARTNKFLHYLSSNYPNATSMSNGGSGSNQGYYLSASDTASLTAIFEKISQEIATPSIPLDSTTEIKDIIAPTFTVPENTQAINLYTEAYTGSAFSGNRVPAGDDVTASIENDTISVNGFDFNANFVSDTEKPNNGGYGKKLIIEFTVATKEGFIGGNGVPTNGDTSGVYLADGAEVELFKVPTVDVPINYTFDSQDQSIYLGNKASLEDLYVEKITPDGKNNAYVNIVYELRDTKNNNALLATMTIEAGETTGTWVWEKGADENPALTEDNKYAISCTVTPTMEGTVQASTLSNQAPEVYVFKPEVTFNDSEIFLGEKADYENNTPENNVTWKHNGDVANADMGPAPELSYTYDPEADAFTEDTNVKVTVKIVVGDKDVTEYTSFVNNDDPDANDHQFTVEVKSGTLKITKNGNVDEEEGFIFNVCVDGVPYTTVSVKGKGTVTLSGLPAGTYSVTEDTGWSWRYTPEYSSSQVIIDSDNNSGEVIVTNKKDNNNWLGGEAYVRNVATTVSTGDGN